MDTNINTREVFAYFNSLELENIELKKRLEFLNNSEVIVDKYYNIALTTNEVAKLHSNTPALVRKYIDLGLIEKHPKSTDAKILVRASDALLLDFKELKQIAKCR